MRTTCEAQTSQGALQCPGLGAWWGAQGCPEQLWGWHPIPPLVTACMCNFLLLEIHSLLLACAYWAFCIACLQSLLDAVAWKIGCYYRVTIQVVWGGGLFLSIFVALESSYMIFLHLPTREMDIILTCLTMLRSFYLYKEIILIP